MHGIHLCYICAITTVLYVTSSNYGKSGLILRVHKSVSRIGADKVRLLYHKHFRLSRLGQFTPDPTGELTALPRPSGQIVGERGRGTAFPFRFWRGNAVPLAYTMTATYNTSNKKCVLNA